MEWTPPVTFFFKVEFSNGPTPIPDTSFREVSGLSMEIETESLDEGGENNFTHYIPVKVKHENLILIRALEPLDNQLENWVRNTLEGGFNKRITPYTLTISLCSQEGVVASWQAGNAYPIKWEISSFHAEKNELAVETIEFAYHQLNRLK